MKRKKYIWLVRYTTDGVRFSDWCKNLTQYRATVSIVKSLGVKYTVTKYELKEVQYD